MTLHDERKHVTSPETMFKTAREALHNADRLSRKLADLSVEHMRREQILEVLSQTRAATAAIEALDVWRKNH